MTGRRRKNAIADLQTSGSAVSIAPMHLSKLAAKQQAQEMATASPPTMASTNTGSSSIPIRRTQDEDLHVPAVSSPLNPDVASSRSRKGPAPREQREKKESLKKRESKASSVVADNRGGTPELNTGRKKFKTTSETMVMSPTRYKLPPPKPMDFEEPKAPVLLPHHMLGDIQIYETSEQYDQKISYML